MKDPKYPIGKFEPQPFSEEQKNKWLLDIHFLPQELERALLNLDEAQLHTPYREGGWTVHEVVHHLADSHMNAYCRFKLGLTENIPTIKPYLENEWTLLDDVKQLPVNVSITLLHALHQRWHVAIKNLSAEQWQREVHHPESKRDMSLWFLLGLYAWHGKHHVAHITHLREQKNWL
ncbi:MAG: putative metal-dependent hydrolase [Sediminibacterium sp.]|nr:putative metal-dependent hydrolase [Sediminibacterium sp.]TXT31937.1 MAG: metal-dependent hydrolase [Chitinophagaceae bacterium]